MRVHGWVQFFLQRVLRVSTRRPEASTGQGDTAALDEIYARHAGRHGPNRLLPAEVLPAHDRLPGHGGTSPQDAGPEGRTAEPSTPTACTRHGSLR
jgi:hypothetical protein